MKAENNHISKRSVLRIVRGAVIVAAIFLALIPVMGFAQIPSLTPSITTAQNLGTAYVSVPFSVTLTATGITPISWSIASGTLPSGLSINASSGVISGTPTASGNYSFTVRATNIFGNGTKQFTLTVSPAPSITSHPANRTIQAGSGTTFSVSASSVGFAYNYMWEYRATAGDRWLSVLNGGIYSNATTATLSLNNVPATYNGYQYRCVVANSGYTWSISSNVATLTVNSRPPDIKMQPQDKTTTAGTGTSFDFDISNVSGTLSLQWQVSTNSGSSWSNVPNSGIYSGATSLKLTLSNGVTTAYNGYLFRCVATVTQSPAVPASVTSNSARLTVLPAGTPPTITTTSLPNGVRGTFYSTTLAATGTTPITWSILISNINPLPPGLSFNTSTGVISGTPTTTGTYTFTVIAQNTIGDDRKPFTIVITDPQPGISPAITSHPANRTISEGAGTSFSVTTAYPDRITYQYQWQHRANSSATWSNVSGGIYSNATTATLTLTNVPFTYNNYQYRCRVIAPDRNNWTEDSQNATLTVTQTVTPPYITTQPVSRNITEGERPSFSVAATNCTGTFSYQWQYKTNASASWTNVTNNNIYSGATTSTLTLSTSVTTLYSGYQYRCRVVCSSMPDHVLYSNDVVLTVSPPGPPSVIEVTSPSPSAPFCTANDVLPISFRKLDNTHPMKYRLRFSDDSKAAGFKDGTTFENLPADLSFKIEVPKSASTKSYAGAVVIQCEGVTTYKDEYPFTFSVTNNGVAIVNQPPAMQSLCGGAPVTLGVIISGNAAGYQWYRNNQAISGAREKEYVASTEGNYYVEIRGTCGNLRSAVSAVVPPSANPSAVTVRVKWGNVLYAENATDKYERFQWMHNKTPINGATYIYLYEKNGFLGEYCVRCYKADGTYDETCPVVFDVRTRSGIEIYPTIVKSNDVLNINFADPNTLTGFETLLGLGGFEATVEIYSLLGIQVYSTKITTPVSTIRPDFRQKGNYFVKIKLPSGEVVTEKIVIQ